MSVSFSEIAVIVSKVHQIEVGLISGMVQQSQEVALDIFDPAGLLMIGVDREEQIVGLQLHQPAYDYHGRFILAAHPYGRSGGVQYVIQDMEDDVNIGLPGWVAEDEVVVFVQVLDVLHCVTFCLTFGSFGDILVYIGVIVYWCL